MRLALGAGQRQELVAEGLDRALGGGGIERGGRGDQPALGQRPDLEVGADRAYGVLAVSYFLVILAAETWFWCTAARSWRVVPALQRSDFGSMGRQRSDR